MGEKDTTAFTSATTTTTAAAAAVDRTTTTTSGGRQSRMSPGLVIRISATIVNTICLSLLF